MPLAALLVMALASHGFSLAAARTVADRQLTGLATVSGCYWRSEHVAACRAITPLAPLIQDGTAQQFTWVETVRRTGGCSVPGSVTWTGPHSGIVTGGLGAPVYCNRGPLMAAMDPSTFTAAPTWLAPRR
jgi:hypothetical protein